MNASSPASNELPPESPLSDDNSALSIITAHSDSTIATSVGSPCSVGSPSVVTPTEPYIKGDRHTLQFFIDVTASLVSRSRAAPIFWKKYVPQAAWTYPSVRHAMLASAISSEALVRQVTGSERQATDLQILTHTSKAVRSLLSENVPLDVVLLTSATLGILDLFNGQWGIACTHVTHGAKLAKQARQDRNSDPFIAFYCEAFASALPLILKNAQDGDKKPPVEKNAIVRLDEAVRSLKLANRSFDETLPKLTSYHDEDRDRITTVINYAKSETDWILTRWEALLHEETQRSSPPDDETKVNLHRIESPFSIVMEELNEHLDSGGPFDCAKFEVAMERTMPFYTLSKSGPNLKMRQIAVQLMRNGAGLRSDRPLLPSDSPAFAHSQTATDTKNNVDS